jgi:hypothetical protein
MRLIDKLRRKGLATERLRRLEWEPAKATIPSMIVVGTHHKTGTNYAHAVLPVLAEVLGFKYVRYSGRRLAREIDLRPRAILSFTHLQPEHIDVVQRSGFSGRIMHLIRDPRTLVVSACKYHMSSQEEWLDRKQERFDGLSYREHLQALPSEIERLLFELNNVSGMQIRDMLACAAIQGVENVKLEDISSDVTLRTHLDFLLAMGLSGSLLLPLLNLLMKQSLWAMKSLPAHSVTGMSSFPSHLYQSAFYEEYVRTFADAHTRLGYP